ncbi:hypothetical protein GW17_00056317 [Ensete ventricosum]|nr:hypothetical protein GW17_00056317 [Ensete ventricosum]
MASRFNKQKLHGLGTLLGGLLRWRKLKNRGQRKEEDGSRHGEQTNECKQKGAIRLKLVLTKEEATQLLAMYVRGKEEAVEEFVGELESAQARRGGAWRPTLASIPED